MCNHWLWCKNRRQEFIRFQIQLSHPAHPYAKANVPGSKHSSSGMYVFQGVGFLFCRKYDLLQYSPTSYSQCFNIFRCVSHFLFSLIYCWRKNWLASHDSFCILNNFIVFEQQTENRTLDSYGIISGFSSACRKENSWHGTMQCLTTISSSFPLFHWKTGSYLSSMRKIMYSQNQHRGCGIRKVYF